MDCLILLQPRQNSVLYHHFHYKYLVIEYLLTFVVFVVNEVKDREVIQSLL